MRGVGEVAANNARRGRDGGEDRQTDRQETLLRSFSQ